MRRLLIVPNQCAATRRHQQQQRRAGRRQFFDADFCRAMRNKRRALTLFPHGAAFGVRQHPLRRSGATFVRTYYIVSRKVVAMVVRLRKIVSFGIVVGVLGLRHSKSGESLLS